MNRSDSCAPGTNHPMAQKAQEEEAEGRNSKASCRRPREVPVGSPLACPPKPWRRRIGGPSTSVDLGINFRSLTLSGRPDPALCTRLPPNFHRHPYHGRWFFQLSPVRHRALVSRRTSGRSGSGGRPSRRAIHQSEGALRSLSRRGIRAPRPRRLSARALPHAVGTHRDFPLPGIRF